MYTGGQAARSRPGSSRASCRSSSDGPAGALLGGGGEGSGAELRASSELSSRANSVLQLHLQQSLARLDIELAELAGGRPPQGHLEGGSSSSSSSSVQAATAVLQEAQRAQAGAACTTAAGGAADASDNGQEDARQQAEACLVAPAAKDHQLLPSPEQQPLQWHHRAARARSLPTAPDTSAGPEQQALLPPGQPLAATPSTAAAGVVCHIDVVNVGKPRRLLPEMPLPVQLCGTAAAGCNPTSKPLQPAPLPAASSSTARQQLLPPLHDRPGWPGPGAALAGLPGGSSHGRPPTLHTSARAAARPARMQPLQPAPVVAATWRQQQQQQPQHQQQEQQEQQEAAWHAWQQQQLEQQQQLQHHQMGWWQQWPAGWQYGQPAQQPEVHWGYRSGHLAW